MSLTKIPFILLATWGFHVSITSPNPPPSRDERIASRMPLENATYTSWGPVIASFFQVLICAVEITTILASANPSSPLSKFFLSLFVWDGGKPENLRMSNGNTIGLILMVLGMGIRRITFRYLGRFFRFEISIQKDHKLIVSGPYAVVRHPSYTAMVFLFIGWFLWQMSKGSWIIESGLWNMILGKILVLTYIAFFIIGPSLLIVTRIPAEDAALRAHFGKKWDDWAKDVPYAIFPGIY